MALAVRDRQRQEYRAQILYRLHWRGKWGGAHTDVKNLQSGFPGHLRGLAKELTDELVAEGLILTKPTNYGLHVSLNPEKQNEIKSRIYEFYPLDSLSERGRKS